MPRYKWIPPDERVEGNAWVEINGIPKDHNAGLNGPVYCPENGYYDIVLGRRFETKSEKRQYMREKGLKMEGNDKPVDKRGVKYFYNK